MSDPRPYPEGAAPFRRRAVLAAGLAATGAVVVAATEGVLPVPAALRPVLMRDRGPAGVIPSAPEGQIRLEHLASRARGQTVGLFTAVPAGLGEGAGLPVCLVLHGASATSADFQRFGLGRFLTAAVQAGAPPFALVGADGGRTFWRGDGAGDDPQAMLRDEIPRWCAERGFDPTRLAVYGWSMGGHGALAFAEQAAARLAPGAPSVAHQRGTSPAAGLPRAVAALSPAVRDGDEVTRSADRLGDIPVGLWCGRSDSLLPQVQALARALPQPPEVASWQRGGHTREFWNRVTPDAFRLIGRHLGDPAT